MTEPWKPDDVRALAEFHGHHERRKRGTKKCDDCAGRGFHEEVDEGGEVTHFADCDPCKGEGEVPAPPGEAG